MISTPCGQYAGSQARKKLHDRLLNAVVNKSIYFFQVTPFGRVMNRFSCDMAVVDKVNCERKSYFKLVGGELSYWNSREVLTVSAADSN